LSDEQSRAYRELVASKEGVHRARHCCTVSRAQEKTEVYIHLIADALENGKTVLFLVPEIALTTQLIQRLELHFKRFLQVYHSRFTTRERTETWLEVLRKKRKWFSGTIDRRSQICHVFAFPRSGFDHRG
jgi:primosomal protein N' (replication factor Y)